MASQTSHVHKPQQQPQQQQQQQQDAINTSMTVRYRFIVEYNGSRFNGFQRQADQSTTDHNHNQNQQPAKKHRRGLSAQGKLQKELITIQQCLEDALIQYTSLPRKDLQFVFAGRTDAGVHARGQVVATNLPQHLCSYNRTTPPNHDNKSIEEWVDVPGWSIQKAINSRLPCDISIHNVIRCTDSSFDPRHDAKSKTYSYTIKYRRRIPSHTNTSANTTADSCHSALQKQLPERYQLMDSGPNTIRSALDDPPTLWVCPWSLDDTKLQYWCEQLAGTHDYSAFVHKRERRKKDNTMTVDSVTCCHQQKQCRRQDGSTQDASSVNKNEAGDEDDSVIVATFYVKGKGFRRCMVRNLIGFLVDLCRGKVDDDEGDLFERIWDGSDTSARLINAAPACGLCLEVVEY